ncbi:MAG: hypothetical protein K8R87_13950 [Verrucomicrobia bacterium]|nr:hypothetical protein [Verrucomicrobiota bacterium]
MPLSAKAIHFFSPQTLTIMALLALCSVASAQVGVAPSQTGLFFNDIRVRADQVRNGPSSQYAPTRATTGTEGVYTFDQSQYTSQPNDRYGMPSVNGYDDITRPVGTTPNSNTRRVVGGGSGYNGAYPSTSTFFAPTYISDPFLSGRRNVKLGPVNIGLGLSGAVEYNDNILRASTHRSTTATTGTTTDANVPALSGKISDYIGSAYLSVDLNYPITEYNSLSLTLGLGVSQYLEHPEYSGNRNGFELTVLPGSALVFNIKVGKVVFIFYDRMWVQPGSRDSFTLDNNYVFGTFQNDAGIGMNWAINSQLNLSLNFNRSDTFALQDIDKRYDRTVHSVSGSLAWTPTGTWTIGLEGSFSLIDYQQEFNNDGNTTSIGVFVVLPLTKNTVVRVAGGVQRFSFDSPPEFTRTVTDQDVASTQSSITNLNDQIAAINVRATDPAQVKAAQTQLASLQSQLSQAQDTLAQQTTTKSSEDTTFNSRSFDRSSDQNGYYYNVVISNQLNARISQHLAFGHETSLNNTSNLSTADYVSYGMGIIAWRGARISLNAYYEDTVQSGGNLREDLKQYGFDISLTHRLGEHLTGGIGYHYGNFDSALALRDYVQHSYTINLSYQLSSKWNVGLGYQFWKTIADNPNQSFTQNQIILSTNYNF